MEHTIYGLVADGALLFFKFLMFIVLLLALAVLIIGAKTKRYIRKLEKEEAEAARFKNQVLNICEEYIKEMHHNQRKLICQRINEYEDATEKRFKNLDNKLKVAFDKVDKNCLIFDKARKMTDRRLSAFHVRLENESEMRRQGRAENLKTFETLIEIQKNNGILISQALKVQRENLNELKTEVAYHVLNSGTHYEEVKDSNAQFLANKEYFKNHLSMNKENVKS